MRFPLWSVFGLFCVLRICGLSIICVIYLRNEYKYPHPANCPQTRYRSELTRWCLCGFCFLRHTRKMVRDTLVDTLGGADGLYSRHPLFHAEQNDRARHRRRAQHPLFRGAVHHRLRRRSLHHLRKDSLIQMRVVSTNGTKCRTSRRRRTKKARISMVKL